jgi:NitT/TauT family transport system substrate-binding protein
MKAITITAAVALAAAATGAGAEGLSLQLNWTAGGDHAPVYYAQAQGWYAAAGVDLDIREGSGSGASATALEVGQAEVAIIDTPTALQFLAKGAPLNGIFVAYNDNAAGLYWKRSSGIATVADLAGKKIGAPAFDATRQMWTPYAAAIGVNADSVEWVNVQPTGKIAALQSGAIDATTHFYSVHFIYEDIFGDDLGFALMRDYGMNTYGLAYFASDSAIAAKEDTIRNFVTVTQKAFAFCLETPEPCAQALSAAVSMKQSDAARQLDYAMRVMPGTDNPNPIGAWDLDRVKADYAVVQQAFGLPDLDAAAAFTNAFIDPAIAYPAK